MIDPVTGQELSAGWRHPSTMPSAADSSQPAFSCLVLLGNKAELKEDVAFFSKLENRIHVARYNTNLVSIGGNFAFDVPDIVAWQPLPGIFK